MPLLVGNRARRGHDAVVDIGQRAAGGGVEQPVVPRVADAAAEGREPALLHLVAERGVGREFGGAALLARGRGVTLEAEHDVAALDIETRRDADDAAAEIDPRRLIGAGRIAVHHGAAPGATGGEPNIGAGPGVERGRSRLVDRRNAEVGSGRPASTSPTPAPMPTTPCLRTAFSSSSDLDRTHPAFGIEIRARRIRVH